MQKEGWIFFLTFFNIASNQVYLGGWYLLVNKNEDCGASAEVCTLLQMPLSMRMSHVFENLLYNYYSSD